ncbi:hypothetical protein Goari_015980 [Gossypium aridum]|uniref:Uncharacterized protein n=1 Tax=Gossypium aridum TaxID=34290 RepID=A0A7J8WH49_GOSAI|nr:hypothetical protein [Gossypium aridum]
MSPMPNFVKRPSLFFCIENKRSQNHSPRLPFMMAITFLPVLVLQASLSTELSQTSSIGFYRSRHSSGQPIIQRRLRSPGWPVIGQRFFRERRGHSIIHQQLRYQENPS